METRINTSQVDFTKDTYPRNLARIALEIFSLWKKPNPYAVEYLNAMLHIHSTKADATYFAEDAETLVRYFLSNASGFRGEAAKRIKAELKKQYNIK